MLDSHLRFRLCRSRNTLALCAVCGKNAPAGSGLLFGMDP